MTCALAMTGRSAISSPSVLTKSLGPFGKRPNEAGVADCPDRGPAILDGNRPSDFDTTSENVPCQRCDIRFVPVIVMPLYVVKSGSPDGPEALVMRKTLCADGVSSLYTLTV